MKGCRIISSRLNVQGMKSIYTYCSCGWSFESLGWDESSRASVNVHVREHLGGVA